MEKSKTELLFVTVLEVLALIVISALAYLPFLFKLGYYFDDWYLMFAAGTRGAEVFQDIFSVDRPGRAFVMMPIYSLFGGNPMYYNLSAYLFRLLGAFGFLAIVRTLWTRERGVTFVMALLFLIYPGFLSQPNAIDYQSHLAGLAAAMWSIGFTLKAMNSTPRLNQVGYFTVSILLGFFYLSQIEWYIGFEATRWACVFLLSLRSEGTLRQRITWMLRSAYLTFIIPLFFLAWRLLFFQSERGATDVGLQLGGLFAAPIATLGLWIISLAKDAVNVLLAAWVLPLSRYAFSMDTRPILMATGLGMVAVALTMFSLRREETMETEQHLQNPGWKREAMGLGVAVLLFGLIPVVLANREVSFPSYSRYTLASSAGAVMMIVAVIHELSNVKLRTSIFSVLVLFSILTHYGNGFEHARWAEEYRNFWWQISWRIPQFEKSTTLIATYPAGAIEEDYFVWGPASLIYYPERQNPDVVQPGLFAAVLNKDTVTKILSGERQEYDNRRSIITYKNYRNIVVLTQPDKNSCVHVINGGQPEYSNNEQDSIRLIGFYSEVERVLVDEMPHTPPAIVFGSEPPHDWCYYYQKADLARQRGEWDQVLNMGEQAWGQGLEPKDLIEWMPFLQAYAQAGDIERLMALAPVISAEPYVSLQACRILGSMPGIASSVAEVVDSQYCPE